jgi:hypothetical protein
MKNTFIGAPMERREDLRFLRGRGEYVDDLAVEGLLYAVILRSSVAHGRIASPDTSGALKCPGACGDHRRTMLGWRRPHTDAAAAAAGIANLRAASAGA